MPFDETWSAIQRELSPGMRFEHSTGDGRPLGNAARVTKVSSAFVEVETPTTQTVEQIPMDDFEAVYSL